MLQGVYISIICRPFRDICWKCGEKISMFYSFVRFQGSLQVKLKERWVMKTSFTLYYQRRIKHQNLVLNTGNFRINMKFVFQVPQKCWASPLDSFIMEHVDLLFMKMEHLSFFMSFVIIFLLSGDYVSNVSLKSQLISTIQFYDCSWINKFLLYCAFLVYWVGKGKDMSVKVFKKHLLFRIRQLALQLLIASGITKDADTWKSTILLSVRLICLC